MSQRLSLATIQFKADARGATAAIDALRDRAKKAHDEVDLLQAALDSGKETMLGIDGVEFNIAKRLKEAKSEAKDFDNSVHELIRGAQALERVVSNIRLGNIEGSSRAELIGAINAVKSRMRSLREDMPNYDEIKRDFDDVVTEATKQLTRLDHHTEEVIQTLMDGGSVAKGVINEELKGLESLMKLVPHMGEEYGKYARQYDYLRSKVEEMSIAERHSRGEVATANDARRLALQLTEDGVRASVREAAAADELIRKGRERIALLEDERAKRREAANASAQLVASQREDVAAQERTVAALEKKIATDGEKQEADKQAAEASRKAADAAAEAAQREVAALERTKQATADAAAKVDELKRKFSELGGAPARPVAALGATNKELAEAEERLQNLKTTLSNFQNAVAERRGKMSEIEQALGGKPDDSMFDYRNPKLMDAVRADQAAQEAAIAELDKKWDAYWAKQEANARKFAEVVGKELKHVDDNDFDKYVTGAHAELAKSWYRVDLRDTYNLGEFDNKESVLNEWLKTAKLLKKNGGEEGHPEWVANRQVLEGLKKKWDEYQLARRRADNNERQEAAYKELQDQQRAYSKAEAEIAAMEPIIEAKLKGIAEEEQRIAELRERSAKAVREIQSQSDVAARKVDGLKSGAKEVNVTLAQINETIKGAVSGAEAAPGSAIDRLRQRTSEMSIAEKRAMLRLGSFTGLVDVAEQEAGSWGTMRQMSEPEMKSVVESYLGKTIQKGLRDEGALDERLGFVTVDRDKYSLHTIDDLAEFTAKEKAKISEMTSAELRRFVMEQFEEQFGNIKAVLSSGSEDIYYGNRRAINSISHVEEWSRGKSLDAKETEDELDAKQRIVNLTRELLQEEQQLASVSESSAKATQEEVEAYEKELETLTKNLERRKRLSGGDNEDLEKRLSMLEKIGLKEDELTDKNKVQEVVEQRTEEILRREQEMLAEIESAQRSGLTSSADLIKGGNKAYHAAEGAYEKLDYDETLERISDLQTHRAEKVNDDDEPWSEEFADELKYYQEHLKELVHGMLEKGLDVSEGDLENIDYSDEGFGHKLAEKMREIHETIDSEVNAIIDNYHQALKDDMGLDDAYFGEELTKKDVSRQVSNEINSVGRFISEDRQYAQKNQEEIQQLEKEIALKQQLIATSKGSAEADEQKAAVESQLKEATEALTKAQSEQEAQQRKTDAALSSEAAAKEQAAAAAQELAGSTSASTEELVKERQKLDEMNRALEGNISINERRQQELSDTNNKILSETMAIADAEQKRGDVQVASDKNIARSIDLLKERNAVIATNSDEWRENKAAIDQLQESLDASRGKVMSLESALEISGKAGSGAFTGTAKELEAAEAAFARAQQRVGEGSEKWGEYQAHIEQVQKAQAALAKAELESRASILSSDDLSTSNREDIQAAINAGLELIKSYDSASSEADELARKIVNAEEHLKTYGVEAERSARREAKALEDAAKKQAESDELMRKQLAGGNLSESALKAQEQYWQRLIDNPKTAAESLEAYKESLARVQEAQRAMAKAELESRASILGSSDLGMNRAEDIQDAINAGKELIRTYGVAAPEAEALARQIVNAEELLKEYGVEAERSARREAKALEDAAKKQAESDELMRKQLAGGNLSESALKAQEQYWQRLIDNPKTAAESLDEYRHSLDRVHALQEEMVSTKGEAALSFFRGDTSDASASTIDDHLNALKAYRDRLPAQSQADVIAEINGYISSTGEAAKVASGEVMALDDALQLSEKAGREGFKGTSEGLRKAEEALERAVKTTEKGSDAWKEYQAALDRVRVESKNAGITHEAMQEILSRPTNAKNIDQLSAAVKRAKEELKLMEGTVSRNSEEYKTLAERTANAERLLKSLESQSRGTSTAFERAWSRLKTYVGLYVSAGVAMSKISGTFNDLIEMSDKLGEVRKTTDLSADEVGRLSEELMSLDVRTPLNGLLDLSAAAGQLGLHTREDILGFTEAANMLMVALPEMGREGATEMLKVAIATGEVDKIRDEMMRGTIEGSNEVSVAMTKIGSTIDRLRATSASAAPAITDFVKRVGAVGKQSGISIAQVAALGSTVDALGMQIEMSATALSRMIPAIRNNAFAIARAIGVPPETIRNLYDAGKGMEVILMILQHIKDSGKDAESIEKMLGMGGLSEVMSELNQQGARAGIVFAGLSQNVDELRSQLKVAEEAYASNTAIQNEFNKMNDTTAGKLARLRNEIEEWFLSDSFQRTLGGWIESLQSLVKIIKEGGPLSIAFDGIISYLLAFKTGLGEIFILNLPKQFGAISTGFNTMREVIGSGLGTLGEKLHLTTARTKAARIAWSELDATLRANVIGAVVTALTIAGVEVWNYCNRLREANAENGRFNAQLAKEQQSLDELFGKLQKSNLAQGERSKLITELNQKYSRYLGFMASETMSAQELANAHGLIAQRIREEAYERRIMEQEKRVQESHDEDVNAAYGGIGKAVRSVVHRGTDVGALTDDLKSYIDRALREGRIADAGHGRIVFNDIKDAQELRRMIERLPMDNDRRKTGGIGTISIALADYARAAKAQADEMREATANTRADLRIARQNVKEELNKTLDTLTNSLSNFGKSVPLTGAPMLSTSRPSAPSFRVQASGGWRLPGRSSASPSDASVVGSVPSWRSIINEKDLRQVKRFVDLQEQLERTLQQSGTAITKQARANAEAFLAPLEYLNHLRSLLPPEPEDSAAGSSAVGGGSNPWGAPLPAESTDYKNMNATQLVSRRKQMKEFVNALQTDTDVKSVLSEDAALRKAIEQGMSSDMRTVVEWYNTERLKIQDELHARHLNNSGDWKDPEKGRSKSAEKLAKEELKAYMDALDAYYIERDAHIKEALNNGEVTEAEARRQSLRNDLEHYKRREELELLYLSRSSEVSRTEQEAIYDIIAEMTDDTSKMVEATVGRTSKFIKDLGDEGKGVRSGLVKGMATDLNKQHQLVSKYQSQIDAIMAKGFDSADKAYEQFKETLDTLGVMLGKDGLSSSMESFLLRVEELSRLVRSAYDFRDSEEMFEVMSKRAAERLAKSAAAVYAAAAAQRKDEDEEQARHHAAELQQAQRRYQADKDYYEWLQGTDRRAHEQMLVQLREYNDNYTAAIEKMAKQRGQESERRFKNSEAGRGYERQSWWSEALSDAGELSGVWGSPVYRGQPRPGSGLSSGVVTSRSRSVRYGRSGSSTTNSTNVTTRRSSNTSASSRYSDNRVAPTGSTTDTGVFGRWDTAQNELAHIDMQIERQRALIHSTKEYNDALEATRKNELDLAREKVRAEEAKMASLDKNSEEYQRSMEARKQAEEDAARAERSLNDQQAVSDKLYRDQLDALEALYVSRAKKILDMNQIIMDGISQYIQALDSFAERAGTLVGEGAFGDPESRRAAGRELLKDVVKVTAQVLKTWLTNLVMQKILDRQELESKKWVQKEITAVVAGEQIKRIAIEKATSAAEVADATAKGTAQTVKQLGVWGLVASAAIGIALTALSAMATAALDKADSEVKGIAGNAGRISTGMQTYGEGNVDAFTDPGSLKEGRTYTVDAADGRTYRARYMGRNPRTHLTNGPEFHLSGERGQEMIIDADTTREIVMNERDVYHAIRTLSHHQGAGSLPRKGRGMSSFAAGNVDDWSDAGAGISAAGMSAEQAAAMQASLDRNSAVQEALLERLKNPINAIVPLLGEDGIVEGYDRGKAWMERYQG